MKRMSAVDKVVLSGLAGAAIIYGGSKVDLRQRSSADDGVALVSVVAQNTNGVTRISEVYSDYITEPGVYSNAWTRAEDEFTPFAMYWFGDNPPPVEVVAQGGVYIDAWRGSGLGVEVDWRVDDAIEIKAGTRLVLEYGAGRAAFGEAATAAIVPGSLEGTLTVEGWFVGFVTYWRLKLEVPQ